MKANLPVLLVIALLFGLSAATPAYCAPAKSELTFSADLFNPKEGETAWSATGELLFPVGGSNFLLGPSVGLFDLGSVDGTTFGAAAELGVGKSSGLFVGAAVLKLGGDAADLADYTGQARVGVKFGGERGFAKLYAAQTWSREADGAITDPDGTAFVAGLGLRF